MTKNITMALIALGSVWIVTCFVFVFAVARSASRRMPNITFADQLEQPLAQKQSEAREDSAPARHAAPGHIHPVHADPVHAHAVGT